MLFSMLFLYFLFNCIFLQRPHAIMRFLSRIEGKVLLPRARVSRSRNVDLPERRSLIYFGFASQRDSIFTLVDHFREDLRFPRLSLR